MNSFSKIPSFLSDNCRFLISLELSHTCLGDDSVRFIVKAKWQYIAYFSFADNNILFEGVK